MYPKSFERLIECFQLLPGVGAKTAERYAFMMLDAPQEQVELFAQALISCKNDIKRCRICGNISDQDECPICQNENRNPRMICVVQSPKDVIAMEKMQEYAGVYHVLNGLISTSRGIMPEDLNIDALLERISPETEEVIIATNSSLEGETTAMYIGKLIKPTGVKVTRIASGVPVGGDLEYIDEVTLLRALEGRVEM